MTNEQQRVVEEYRRKCEFMSKYDPAKGGKLEDYLGEQDLLIVDGDNNSKKSLITEYTKIKIKDVVNEHNIKWLAETRRVVDNADKVADGIFDTILNKIENGEFVRNRYIMTGGKRFMFPNIQIQFECNASLMRRNRVIDVDCRIYQSTTDVQHKELEDKNLFNLGYDQHKRILYICFDSNPMYYNETNIRANISHELAHHFQWENHADNYDAEFPKHKGYNKEYESILKQYGQEQDEDKKKFLHLNYFFTKSEISADMTKLHKELTGYKIDTTNRVDIYKRTNFYKEYSQMLSAFNYLQTLPNQKWEGFRKMSQIEGNEFYKPHMKLNKTGAGVVFKNHWIKFINRMVTYTNNSVNNIIIKAIQDVSQPQ